MKYFSCFFIMLFQITLLLGQDTVGIIECPQCEVMKIDSLDHFYLIDVQSNKDKYKIVSRKTQNSCSNLLLGETYKLTLVAMYSLILNSNDYSHHIGRGICINIDWGNNLYQVQQLCGLCYETDSIKLNECKKNIAKEDRFERAMSTIRFFYLSKKEKRKGTSFLEFYEEKQANSIPFVLNDVEEIPVYSFNRHEKTQYIDTMVHKGFSGRVYHEYKNFYFIKGIYVYSNDNEIMGWIDKKDLLRNEGFKKDLKKMKLINCDK